VVIGMGWVGGIASAMLSSAGLSVVGLERGGDRRSEPAISQRSHDELRFLVRQDLVQDTARETWTLRHSVNEVALPLRYAGAFRPGEQLGGSGVTWGGASWRLPPGEFRLRSLISERYGEQRIPADSTIQDWPVSYDDLEPHYSRFEAMAGVSGKAGNVQGIIRPGGNPFEGPRSAEYPLPPHPDSLTSALFGNAASSLGLHPFPVPSANPSRPYVNPDGIHRPACTYCGFCHAHACQSGAKASPVSTVLPLAEASGCFELRTGANVVEITHDNRRAHAVRYYDADGMEHLQPACVVVVAAFTLNSVRLLLMSRLGEPYDPTTGHGVVGRNYCTQNSAGALGFFSETTFNRYMGSSGTGTAFADFCDDNFDHSGLGFVGGGVLSAMARGAAPIEGIALPAGTPRWGLAWKNATRQWYDRSVRISILSQNLAARENYLDLDPTYRDRWGLPLLRITFNWQTNDREQINFLSNKASEVFRVMQATSVTIQELEEFFDTVRYQSTHNTGGAIMGADPRTSVVNRFGQMWDYDNVFVMGGANIPQNPAYPPTATIGALTYMASEAISQRYANRPGSLV
jgi:gluconate 2-dehydrogenase alpha chain